MVKRILTLIMAMVLAMPTGAWAAATQVDALIQKLVEKGILDKNEARSLKMEIAEDAKAIQEDAIKTGLPDWVKNTKLKGDVRVRYQYERRANDTESRTRGRIRYRLGLESQANAQWKVGAGIASTESGSTTDDARSTNMTFNDSFRRGDIRLDYAFAEYTPAPWGKFITGKYIKSDYLWAPTDMLWDTDINPAGASTHLEHKFNDHVAVYGNSGLWVIDENNKTDRTDPYLVYTQAGAKLNQGQFDANVAGTHYAYNGVKGITLDGTAATNTLTGSVLKYDYDAMGVSAEIGVKKPVGELLPIERLAFFGDFVQNLDSGSAEDDGSSSAVDEGTGWAVGAKVGDEKVNGAKQWQLKYQYTSLGKDAWPDAFPDSDRLSGGTDLKGHEWELQIGLSKNVYLGFDYYQDQRVKTTKNPQKIVQADLNVKF